MHSQRLRVLIILDILFIVSDFSQVIIKFEFPFTMYWRCYITSRKDVKEMKLLFDRLIFHIEFTETPMLYLIVPVGRRRLQILLAMVNQNQWNACIISN